MSSLSNRITSLSPRKRELLLRKLQGARKERPDAITIRRRIEQDRYPLSHSQRRLWFLDQLEPGKASYNIPAVLRFSGALRLAAVERSLNEILRRHEVLRSAFITVEGDPQAIILPALALSLPVTDLQSLPEEEREQAALRLANVEARLAFDLARGPLVRASLVRLTQTEHILILVMHHIVADGWSVGVFLRELAAIYQTFASGGESPLADPPIQYADFAHWQQEEQMKGDRLASQIAYWTKHLSGAPPVLDLPTDRPRPPVQTYNGAHLTVTLPKQLAADVAAFSQGEGVTPFVTLLAAFQSLLSHYTGQEDLSVGTPVANRRHTELDGLIGFFASTLVMRADLTGDPSFRELTGQVRETHWGADANQDLPFEMLVEAMQPERDLSRSPLFQVMFAHQQPVAAPDLPGLAIRALEIETGTAKFDLLLTVEPGPASSNGLRTIWEYNTDLFDKATIARMAGHYQTLLSRAVADPDLPVSRLPILPVAERRRILDQWNDTAVTYHPRGACLHRLFEAQVARTPNATALIYQGQRLSYSALNKRANQLARRLQRLGVGRESLVGVSMERSLEMVVALYAILKAGGAYLPIDPADPPERLAFMLSDARPPVLLTQSHLASRFPAIEARLICLDAEWGRLAEENADNLDSGVTEENLAYAIYTSGSTGQPKCALIQHKGICNRLLWMQDEYQLSSEDCVLQKTPFSFDVSVWEFFWPLQVGARLVVAHPEGHKDSDYLIELIKRERVTTIHFVPSMLQAFLENERASECPSLRRVICSGEALPIELQQRFFARMEKTGAELHNLYGPTEASVDVSHWACERNENRRTVPIGRPIANTQLYILDRHLQPVPVGVPGELHIGGVGVGRGYLNRPELTAEKFIELGIEDRGSRIEGHSTNNGLRSSILDPRSSIRVYKTGDLARFLPDGAIEYLGRLDHQVKIRGFRIELGEIEAVLTAHPAIRKAAVIVREQRGDKQLVAYCVPEEMPGLAASELRAYLKEKLPDYMTPAQMVMLEALPLSPNGKLDRRALPVPGKADTASESPYVAPRTLIEEMLVGMWADILGIERAGIHDNFFELGGHSLLATRLASRIRDVFRVNLPLRTLFEKPTVAELALRLEAARAGDAGQAPEVAPAITPASREAGRHRRLPLPLSYAQQRLWFLHQLEPESSFYNIPAFVRMAGELDIPALERSLGEVVRRHEVMRTIFPDLDGEPAQVIQEPQPVSLRIAEPDESVPRAVASAAPSIGRLRGQRSLPLAAPDSIEKSDEVVQILAGIELQKPFDLAVGPLWRAHLLRLAPDDHILFLVMHHIIADGWAMNLLVEELRQLYTAFSAGQPSPLTDLPVQYADYARWQRDWLQGGTLRRQLDYWRGRLSRAPMQLDWGTDRPRPPMQTHNGAAQTFTLPAGLANRLRALGRQEGATLFMTTLAAFQTLLYSCTGQESINVGTPIANRTRSEIERLLGCFINTLVLRADFSGDPSFRETVRQVREAALGAYMHQDVPFEMVVDALEPERDLSRSPLFQVMFSLEERPSLARSLPELRLEALRTRKTTAKFDLSLEMWEEGETLQGEFEYNTDLFDAATIERMLSHFTTLVESLAADPDQRVSRAPLLTRAERRRMLETPPLSTNGKVDRRRLPAPMLEAREEAESALPQTEIEETLAEIWKQVLGLKAAGIHDNFFELGGNSILSIQIIARARQAGIRLTPRQLFENPTVAGQASVASFGHAIQAEQGIVTGEAPLTPIQHWFFEQELAEPWRWNQTALLCVSGGMKRELLEATVARLLEHHDALRMRYCRKDGAWVQTNAGTDAITPKSVCRWFDMAGMSAGWQSAAITRHAGELQASLNLSEGPVMRVAWFNLGPRQPGRLLVVVHHLVVDGVSWRVLMEDLQNIYAQLQLGQTPRLPPKTTSFRQWAQQLSRHAKSEEARRELPYWQAAVEGRTRGLPVDFPAGANTEASAASVVMELSETETSALLQDVPAAYGTEINDALLAALAQALNDWACGAVLVNLEGHGREDIISGVDISRTVGWFTTEFPVRLEWKTGESPGETLMRIKEQLRGIPNRGIGYGILKYLGERGDRLAGAPQAEVSFNYLGQFDQTLPADGLFALANEPAGPSRSLAGNCSYPLEINGGITGGRLQLEWRYGARLYKRETIERVAQAFVTALRELIAHCQSPAPESNIQPDRAHQRQRIAARDHAGPHPVIEVHAAIL